MVKKLHQYSLLLPRLAELQLHKTQQRSRKLSAADVICEHESQPGQH